MPGFLEQMCIGRLAAEEGEDEGIDPADVVCVCVCVCVFVCVCVCVCMRVRACLWLAERICGSTYSGPSLD